MLRGSSWQEVFEGYCDGAAEARERHGVEVRLTPDTTRDFPAALGNRLARWAVKYRERGVVAMSLGGSERKHAPQKFRKAFAIAREGGLGSAPHAGELAGGKAGAASIRGALECCMPTASATASAPSTTRRCSPSSPSGASSAT